MTAARCQVVLLTPPGRGAVATLLVSGEGAASVVERHFGAASNSTIATFPVGRIVFGCWQSAAASAPGEEIVVCRTAVNEVEIHCHGGNAASRAIVEALVADGCIECDWRDWLPTTSFAAIAVAAQIALASVTTTKTAAILLDQFHGALRRELAAIVAACDQGEQRLTMERLEKLQPLGRLGLHLTQPFRVVLAGRPNVGKSSLMNAILGYTRAIVFDEPGTTRDVLTATTAIDGWPVELSDTAGLRASSDAIETEGVSRARRAAAAADLLLLVFDATQPWGAEDQSLVDAYPHALVVTNKVDQRGVGLQTCPSLATSAITGEGIGELIRAIGDFLVPLPPSIGEAVPFTLEQVDSIAFAKAAAANGDLPAAAQRLRQVLT